MGDTTTEPKNFSRAEPDGGLFAPPMDYKIVDENAQFTITCGAPPPNPAVSTGGYRTGGGVSAPVPTYQPEPRYTEEAQRGKIQGTVLVTLVVDADGNPQAMRVTRSLDPGLDQKAIEAVSQWRFRPGQKDGKPVPVMASVELDFRIADRPNQ